MGLLRGYRERKAGKALGQILQETGWAAAKKYVTELPGTLRAGAWAHGAVVVANGGKPLLARDALRESVHLDGTRSDALLLLADLENEAGEADAAIEHYRRLLALHPRAAGAALKLARLLLAAERFGEVTELLDPFTSLELTDVAICQAQACFALGQHERVVELLEPLGARLRTAMSMSLSRDELRDIDQQQRELSTLYDDAYAACHGRERVIESPLMAGQLDARSGVNYHLLGEARMARPPAWKPDATLRSVADSMTFAQRLIDEGQRSRGLCHLGAAHLRGGDLDRARDHFERARELDDDNFAAYLGIGAVLAYDQHRCRAKVDRLFLPGGAEPPGLRDVVVDWLALTEEERRAVMAAALPLASLLPNVAEGGGQARILPIDARPVDLAAFAPERGERDGWDQRCVDAITGVATREMCVAKIESLLDIGSLGGWVFAHELAHLVHFHAPEDVQRRIEALYGQLGEEDYLLTTYESKNSAEFFAVAYVDYLDRRWELPTTRELDADGLLGEVFAFFDELGHRRG